MVDTLVRGTLGGFAVFLGGGGGGLGAGVCAVAAGARVGCVFGGVGPEGGLAEGGTCGGDGEVGV